MLEQGHEGGDGTGGPLGLVASFEVTVVVLAGGDAGVYNPDGVGDDDSGRAGNGTGNHGLDGGELLAGATGRGGGALKERACPFVPVVVDKVGDADAKERRVDARVQAREALARNNLLHRLDELALVLLGLDLRPG